MRKDIIGRAYDLRVNHLLTKIKTMNLNDLDAFDFKRVFDNTEQVLLNSFLRTTLENVTGKKIGRDVHFGVMGKEYQCYYICIINDLMNGHISFDNLKYPGNK